MKIKNAFGLSLVLLTINAIPVYADQTDDTFNFSNTELSGYTSVSTTDDVTSLVINPGAIGLRSEGELFFSNSVYSSLPQTNLLATYSNFNIGLQQFTPRGTLLPPMRKYIAGFGMTLFNGLSAGATYYNIQPGDNATTPGASSFDIGVLFRPADFLSLGIVGRNLLNPVWAGRTIQRNYVASIGFRPGGWDRLTIKLDGSWVEGSPLDRIRGLVGVETEIIDGIIIKGHVTSDPTFKQLSWGFNMGVNFPYLGVGYGRTFDASGNRDGAYARLTLNHTRTVFEASESEFAEINMVGSIRPNKDNAMGLFSVDSQNSVFDYLQAIEKAQTDKSIAGIILNIQGVSSGLATNEELRVRLTEFKKSGKKIIAYLRSADIKDYYLASVADQIIMHPIGEIQLEGLAAVQYFYKDLLDKIGVQAQFEKAGKFKSATEPMTENKASSEEKEQLSAFLGDMYSEISDAICKSRKLTSEELKKLIDNKTIINSTEAKELKLVDQIDHYDNIGKIAAKMFNYTGKFPLVRIMDRQYQTYAWREKGVVAIINAGGTIIEGNSTRDFLSGESTMGADSIARLLRRARRDNDIKAVVLRVDSGGGSALASDIIGREIFLYKEEKKPLVVSMANVSASGGYWLATDATKIVANNNTLTGSIGVFAGKMNFSALLKKLGVNTEVVKIGEHADAFSESRPFSDDEKKILDKSVQNLYRLFLERVSTGRNIPIQEVEKIAEGRIYSGKRAKELKLIDEIGGLDKAVEIARTLAELKGENIETINYRPVTMDTIVSLDNTKQSFYPMILWNLVNENRALAIMPNFNY